VFIHGIPITSDPSLSWEEVSKIVEELVHTWNWEGRKLGKIELIRDGPWIRIYTYKTPLMQLVPAKNSLEAKSTLNNFRE
jgi:hypothetical protein